MEQLTMRLVQEATIIWRLNLKRKNRRRYQYLNRLIVSLNLPTKRNFKSQALVPTNLETPWKINWSTRFKGVIEVNLVQHKSDRKILRMKKFQAQQIMIQNKSRMKRILYLFLNRNQTGRDWLIKTTFLLQAYTIPIFMTSQPELLRKNNRILI